MSMYSTPRQELSLSFDAANLDVPQPRTVVHRNVAYSGEVIIAETLNPRWLLPLEGGLDFRLVFFTVPRRIGRRPVEDPYSRRLGSHGARMVLASPTGEPLAKFVELVQVADPSALTQVLDDDVVDFLRQFLKGGQP